MVQISSSTSGKNGRLVNAFYLSIFKIQDCFILSGLKLVTHVTYGALDDDVVPYLEF